MCTGQTNSSALTSVRNNDQSLKGNIWSCLTPSQWNRNCCRTSGWWQLQAVRLQMVQLGNRCRHILNPGQSSTNWLLYSTCKYAWTIWRRDGFRAHGFSLLAEPPPHPPPNTHTHPLTIHVTKINLCFPLVFTLLIFPEQIQNTCTEQVCLTIFSWSSELSCKLVKNDPQGSKGLTMFCLETRKSDGTLNNIEIQVSVLHSVLCKC